MRQPRRTPWRAVLGGDIEPSVRPVAAIAFIYTAALSTFWVYVGVYAVRGLGWMPGRVGLLFLLEAPAGAAANYLSGALSDRVGRRRPIVLSFLASGVNMTALAFLGHTTAVAFALIGLQGVIGAPAYSLDRVLVADVVPDGEERDAAYAAVRVAANLGAFAGPPLAAIALRLGGWTAFLLGITSLSLVGAAIAARRLPGPGERAPAESSTPGSLRLVVRDRPFLLLLISTLLGFFVYCCFETVLPVIAVSSYGLAPSTWGLLVAVGPLLIVAGQMRLTRAVARTSPAVRLAAGLLGMGLPFLVLIVSSATAVIAAVIAVFVVGEMVWTPTTQTVAARLAPAHARGTYFGAFAATTGAAWTLAPLIALELRAHAGVAWVWILFAAIAVAAAAVGVAADRAQGDKCTERKPHVSANQRGTTSSSARSRAVPAAASTTHHDTTASVPGGAPGSGGSR